MPRSPPARRVLILFVIVLTVLLGLVGLVLDGGLLMASHRRAQNVPTRPPSPPRWN